MSFKMKPDAYPQAENSDIVKTYYYWQMGKLYIGGVPIGGAGPGYVSMGPLTDPFLSTVLALLLKKRPSDGFVKTEIILT